MSSIASVVVQRRRHGDDDCSDVGRVDCDSTATKRKLALSNVVGDHGLSAGRRRAFCDIKLLLQELREFLQLVDPSPETFEELSAATSQTLIEAHIALHPMALMRFEIYFGNSLYAFHWNSCTDFRHSFDALWNSFCRKPLRSRRVTGCEKSISEIFIKCMATRNFVCRFFEKKQFFFSCFSFSKQA